MRERVAGERRLQEVLEVLRAHPETARLSLVYLEAHRASRRLVPVELHVTRLGVVSDAGGEIVRDLPHRGDLWPGDPELHRIADGRPILESADACAQAGVAGAQQLIQR